MSLVRITNAILGDENTVMVVSTYDKTNDLYLGLPSIINKNGASKKIDFYLTEEETNKLIYSIKVIFFNKLFSFRDSRIESPFE